MIRLSDIKRLDKTTDSEHLATLLEVPTRHAYGDEFKHELDVVGLLSAAEWFANYLSNKSYADRSDFTEAVKMVERAVYDLRVQESTGRTAVETDA